MRKVAPIVLQIAICLLMILFAYSATAKLMEFNVFKNQLSMSPYLELFSKPIAILLPSVEIILAILLVFETTRMIGLNIALYLMTLFTIYIYSMLNFSYHIPCSCGGVLSMMSWTQHLWFNVFFTVLTVITIILHDGLRVKDKIK